MKKRNSKTATPPNSPDLENLKRAAKKCLVCDFAKKATQTVFGEGGRSPILMIVGEVPGDMEDRLGHPFVGPAGKRLRALLNELGIDARKVYLTNAVKHFKYVRLGKRRLHQRPNAEETKACRPWLKAEINALRPSVILALGATAAASIFERMVGIQRERSKLLSVPSLDAKVMVSWHPSAVLRAPLRALRQEKREQLKQDLNAAWKIAEKGIQE